MILPTLALLLLPCAGYAASPADASLKGTYAFQMSQSELVTWQRLVSVTCFGVTYTHEPSGMSVDTQVIAGTVTFSGSGTFSMAITKYGVFDQAASNATVSASCTGNPHAPVTTNGGHPVLSNGVESTTTGTYTVGSDGTGTFTLAGSNSDEVIDLLLGQFNGENVATQVLFRQVLKNNGNGATGVGILK